LQIDQLPDSRRAILEALKQLGSLTIARLAGELHLTGEAVRQQLLQLRRDGCVEPSETERSGIGRPATKYRLTVAGDHLFPKRYDTLLVALVDAMGKELGPDVTLRLFSRLADEAVERLEPATRNLPIEKRIEALKNFYADDDPYMSVEQGAEGFDLVERNCPFYNVAMKRTGICDVTVRALSRLAGVRVVRGKTFQNGDGCCTFRVYRNESADAEKLKIAAEPPAGA
jgi:predicted ArsR family transcriptional regulator